MSGMTEPMGALAQLCERGGRWLRMTRRSTDAVSNLARFPGRLLAIACGQILATVATALLAHRLIQSFGRGEPLDRWMAAGLIGSIAISVAMRYRERVDGEAFGQRIAHSVRMVLTRHLMSLPATERSTTDGEVILRFVGDLTALRNWYAKGLVALLIALPVLAGGVAVLGWLDLWLGVAVGVMVAVIIGLQTLLGPSLRMAGHSARRERARLARSVVEASQTLASIQLFGRSMAKRRQVEKRSSALVRSMCHRAHWSGLMRAVSDLGATGLPIAILAVWLLRGEADLGTSAVALMLSGLLAPRIRELAHIREYWEMASISRERIAAFLARASLSDRSNAKGLASSEGALALRKLTVAGVFQNIAAEAPGGARIALTGPNGAGKSRLLGTIAGLEMPAAGRVVIDGQDATKRRLAAQRRAISLASADTPLVRGSVDYNIHYGARAHGEDADFLCAMGGYEELLAELPDAAETRVGAGGRGISAGQRARIALLRALLRKPVVLLLDEIEANLDAAGNRVLANVLDTFPGTIVMATHDERWLSHCTHVWTLEHGNLTAKETGQNAND